MKILHIAIILFIFNTVYIFSQSISTQTYDSLAALFSTDVQLKANMQDVYSLPKPGNTFQSSTFSHKMVSYMPYLNTNGIRKILIIVDSLLYSQVEYRIKRYARDIHYVYGCEIIIEIVSNSECQDIKNLIISNSNNLNGTVLIGDVPTAWFEISNDHNKYGYDKWPCDLYYMDINGLWQDMDRNGIFDKHTGNTRFETFVGRIFTKNVSNSISEKTALENYLDKNHNYWMGKLPINKQFALSYTDRDWANFLYFRNDISNIYRYSQYDAIYYPNSLFSKSDYLNRLSNDRYEFIQLACHSSPTFHAVSNGSTATSYIYSSEIFNSVKEAVAYNLFCCSACRWTTSNCLAASYIYGNNSSGLVLVGSTKTGSMLAFNKFYSPLGNGKTFGESFVAWWNNAMGAIGNYEISWYYGLTIIGDPMINLHYCTNNKCQNQIVLTTFDNNLPTVQYHISKDLIKTTNNVNYTIPSNKSVIMNSKAIELNAGFKVENGAELIIYTEGCDSNCP